MAGGRGRVGAQKVTTWPLESVSVRVWWEQSDSWTEHHQGLKSCQKWRVLTKQTKPSSTWKAQTEAEAVRAVRRTRRGQVPREAGGVPGNPTHRLPRLRIRRRRVPIGRDWSSHLMQTSSKTMLWVSYINSCFSRKFSLITTVRVYHCFLSMKVCS